MTIDFIFVRFSGESKQAFTTPFAALEARAAVGNKGIEGAHLV